MFRQFAQMTSREISLAALRYADQFDPAMARKFCRDNFESRAVKTCSRVASSRRACAMLPLCERVLSVPRKQISPVWTRSFPVSKQPKTLGEQLRKKRFDLGLRQSEIAKG